MIFPAIIIDMWNIKWIEIFDLGEHGDPDIEDGVDIRISSIFFLEIFTRIADSVVVGPFILSRSFFRNIEQTVAVTVDRANYCQIYEVELIILFCQMVQHG